MKSMSSQQIGTAEYLFKLHVPWPLLLSLPEENHCGGVIISLVCAQPPALHPGSWVTNGSKGACSQSTLSSWVNGNACLQQRVISMTAVKPSTILLFYFV